MSCPTGTTTSAEVAVSIHDCNCEDGLYDFRNVFLSCLDKEWSADDEDRLSDQFLRASSQGIQCVPCPSCAECSADGTIALKEQYWTFQAEEKYVPTGYFASWANDTMLNTEKAQVAIIGYRCDDSSTGTRCQGGAWQRHGAGKSCSDGATGPLCSSCLPGFKMTESGCEECSTHHAAESMATHEIVLVVRSEEHTSELQSP